MKVDCRRMPSISIKLDEEEIIWWNVLEQCCYTHVTGFTGFCFSFYLIFSTLVLEKNYRFSTNANNLYADMYVYVAFCLCFFPEKWVAICEATVRRPDFHNKGQDGSEKRKTFIWWIKGVSECVCVCVWISACPGCSLMTPSLNTSLRISVCWQTHTLSAKLTNTFRALQWGPNVFVCAPVCVCLRVCCCTQDFSSFL